MEPQVARLTPEEVGQYWDQIEWRIDSTPELLRFYSKETLIDLISKSEMHIWTAGSDLVLLTAVLATPRGNVLQIVWAHGTGMDDHWEELKEKFHLYAWMTQCKKIEVIGRLGWMRKFMKEQGFSIDYVAYSADVQKPRMN